MEPQSTLAITESQARSMMQQECTLRTRIHPGVSHGKVTVTLKGRFMAQSRQKLK